MRIGSPQTRKILGVALISIAVSTFFIVLTSFFQPTLIVFGKLSTMKSLDSDETKNALRSKFDRDYNFTELCQWEHTKVTFVTNESFERSSDPFKILEIGKGRCGEFSVLYAALTLAHGYESRLVMSIDISSWMLWFPQHEWVEVRVDNQWVHVDPSDQVWNDPSHYRTWPWAKGIGSNVRIYAFEDGKITDLSEYYRAMNQAA
jgi:hypothetical protein